MKISAGLLGVALGQSGDTADYTYDYNEAAEKSDSYTYNAPTYNFNTGYDSGYSQNLGYDAGYYGRSGVEAYALSCWNSNSMRDMNHDNKFATPGEDIIGDAGNHHQYGYENEFSAGSKFDSSKQEYGSDQSAVSGHYGFIEDDNHIDISDVAHSVDAVEPHKWGYQNNNPDAKYHYGHHVASASANRGPTGPQAASSYHGFMADDWRYSLRHSGCLWEVKDFSYSAATYSVQHNLAWTDSSNKGAKVHWVHVFNAHIYAKANNAVNGFRIVMANPVYEGLGYLNFVSTYADTAIAAEGKFTHDPFASTYDISAQYVNSKGTWTLTKTGDSWKLVAGSSAPAFAAAGAAAAGVAISSFPHNQLGADFRFNVRTLHEFGHGFQEAKRTTEANKADSYFWYAVDTITITFPHHVSAMDSCHALRAGASSDTSVDCSKHVHSIIVDENHVTGTDGSYVHTGRLQASITDACNNKYGPSEADDTNHYCASFCANAAITCGKKLTISNVMKTYDEFHLRQYGTIQEIWAQLQYAYTHTVDRSNDSNAATKPTGFESPFPNVFFSAARK